MTENYSSVIQAENSRVFFKKLVTKLDKELTKYFGEEEAADILGKLNEGKLKIINPENYLFTFENLGDTTLSFLKECKNFSEFIQRATFHFKEKVEKGNSKVFIREFFIEIAHLIGNNNKLTDEIEEQLHSDLTNFILNLSSSSKSSPYTFQVLYYKIAPEVGKILKLQTHHYAAVLHIFADCYAKFIRDNTIKHLPKLQFIYTVYKDASKKQKKYIKKLFPSRTQEEIETCLKEVESLSEDSLDLQIALETLAQEDYENIDISEAIEQLKRIEDEEPLKTYSNQTSFYFEDKLRGVGEFPFLFKSDRVSKIFTARNSYYQTFQPYVCNIYADCDKLQRPGICSLIEKAKKLCLIKSYLFPKKDTDTSTYIINLQNVKEFSQEFIYFIENQQKEIQSSTNKNFLINISFSINKATQREACTDHSYVRVISDIHADYNKEYEYDFDFGNDFVINCGDTAGDGYTAKEWCVKNMRKGVVVMGNHLGYSPAYPKLETEWQRKKNRELYGSPHHPDNTKNSQMLILSKAFTGHRGRLRFMSNSEYKLDDIIILGTCLYTDFRLYGDNHVEESMHYAKQNMNDFKLIHVVGHREYTWTPKGWKIKMRKREESKVRLFTPEDHAYFFNFSIKYLKQKVEEYKDEKIIIVTHFAPSPYSISPQYAGSPLNPAFASNLNDFITSNPQIRLWCHGHVHTPCDYILGETRVICNPFGYANENRVKLPRNYGTRIAVRDIQSDLPWTEICRDKIEKGKIKVYKD